MSSPRGQDYGAENRRSWRRVLAPLWMPQGAASAEARVLYDAGNGFLNRLCANGPAGESGPARSRRPSSASTGYRPSAERLPRQVPVVYCHPDSPMAASDGQSPARPLTLGPTEGESFAIIGGGVRILIDGQASGGRCVVWEAPIPPGDGPPLHRHEREDELFYVLDGRFKFALDGRTFIAERGAFVCAPRGSIHSFRNIGAAVGRLLITCTPAGIEAPFRAVRVPDAASGKAPLSMDEMVAIFAGHGITFHGPPLAAD